MRKADVISAAVAAAFGLSLLFYFVPEWVQAHDSSGGYGLGARVMPDVTALLLTGLSVLFFFYRLMGRGRRDAAGKEVDEPSPFTRANQRFLLKTALFVVAMGLLFEWIGFLAAGPITIAGFMIGMGERRPVPILATSVGAAVVIWLFFWQLLSFPLP